MGNTGQLGAWCECLLPGGHSDFLPTPVPPQITGPREPPAQVSVVQDEEATLECNVTGKPPPRVTWQRDGQPVGAAPGLRLQNQGQSLHVERAQAAHAGRYSCLAENVAGRAERRFALSVLGEDRGRPERGWKGAQTGEGKAGSCLILPRGRPLVRSVGGSLQHGSQIRTGLKWP